MDRPRLLSLAGLIVVVSVGIDQLTKWWAVESLADGDTIGLLPTIEFDLTYNSGFSFGTGSGRGQLVGALVVLLIGFLIWQIRNTAAVGRVLLMAVILGGAVGNLIDRLFRAEDGFLSGEVVDFIDVNWYAVFNVADMFVVCGCVAFVIYELRMAKVEHDSSIS